MINLELEGFLVYVGCLFGIVFLISFNILVWLDIFLERGLSLESGVIGRLIMFIFGWYYSNYNQNGQMRDYNIIYIRQMQIKLIKPINTELNHFINRNNLQPTPKRANHHPQTSLPFKENQPLINNLNRSPARSTSRKILNSKEDSLYSIASNDSYGYNQAKNRKSTASLSRKCQNHDQINGDYHINIEGQDLYYCQKCAMKLKNQGFPIKKDIKTQTNSTKHLLPASKPLKTNIQHTYPHLKGHPQFQTLRQLLNNIYSIEQSMKNVYKGQECQQTFSKKQMQIESFYTQLQNIIRLKKNESKITLNQIREHWLDTSSQKQQNMNESLSQINMMKNDIENNIQSIVGQVQEQTFKECVENYQERLQSYQKLIMDKHNDFNKINQSLDSILDNAVLDFSQQMHKVKEEVLQSSDQNKMSEPDENPTYYCKEDINGPFRKLFQNNQKEERRDKSRKRLISQK